MRDGARRGGAVGTATLRSTAAGETTARARCVAGSWTQLTIWRRTSRGASTSAPRVWGRGNEGAICVLVLYNHGKPRRPLCHKKRVQITIRSGATYSYSNRYGMVAKSSILLGQ